MGPLRCSHTHPPSPEKQRTPIKHEPLEKVIEDARRSGCEPVRLRFTLAGPADGLDAGSCDR